MTSAANPQINHLTNITKLCNMNTPSAKYVATMTYQYHDETIIKNLPDDTIFVFGSNMAGTHAGGAAKIALQHFGAMHGVGRGWSGQSFAIPTMNEHLQQMPLSQIEHYIHDFKLYVKNHPKSKFFITAVGCGVAGYKIEEIAPMFKGIAHHVIFPASFRPFVEKTLPKITQKFLHRIIRADVILANDPEELIQQLDLTAAEKSLATILLNTPMFPVDSNGRERDFEIQDIMHTICGKINNLSKDNAVEMTIGGVILALLELYQLNEQDFVDVWLGKKEVSAPTAAHRAKK